jgi:hypothetical protein
MLMQHRVYQWAERPELEPLTDASVTVVPALCRIQRDYDP